MTAQSHGSLTLAWRSMVAGALTLLLSVAHAQPNPNPNPGQPTRPDYPGLDFQGRHFALYKTGPIAGGWAASYTENAQNPDTASDEIIINHLDAMDSQGHTVLPVQVFRAMLNNVKSRGGTIIMPFAVPDKTRPGNHYLYYAPFYYVYPKDGFGDIWLSRVFLTDAGAVGILYRHSLRGSTPATIEQDIRHWLVDNVESSGKALADLSVPAQPLHP